MSRKISSIILSICLLSIFILKYTQPAIAYNNPLLEINVSGYNFTAGDENEMSISIENIGHMNAYDVKASLTVPSTVSGISIVKESYAVFEEIHSIHYPQHTEWMHPVLYVASNCPLGAYSLTLKLEYTDSLDETYSDSVQIGVAVNSVKPTEHTRIAIQNFQVTPTKVFPGNESTVELELKNWGSNAYDVQAKLTIDTQSPFVSLDPTLVFVGDLRLNQTATVVYNLSISGDADANLYRLPLVISYYDVDDQPDSLTEDISIRVHSIINFRLLDIQPSIITAEPGETVAIEADLLLLGTETVEFVEIEIFENRSIGPFLSIPQSYEYIGRVDPDSPVLFTVQFMVDSNATAGSYTLQIRVSCWDGYNQERQTVVDVPVVVNEFSNQNAGSSPTLWDVIWTTIRILFGVRP